MEDISQSCQHYVVLASDQELALSGAEELLLLSAKAGEDALHYPVVKTRKFRTVGCFYYSFLMPQWKIPMGNQLKLLLSCRVVLSTSVPLT